jgi:WD40 repeat protein
MNISKRPPFTAFMIALAVSISSGLVSKTTADDAASSDARRVAAQKFDETFFDARRDLSVEAAQARLSRVLKTRIAAIHRSCGLNDSQTKKLELAGRGAIKRLIEIIAEQKQAFLSEERNYLAASRYLYESPQVLALRKKLRDGPFDEESLFAKTIGNVLIGEQAAKYAKRSALAAGSNRTITAANVVDLVRIAKIQKDVHRVEWDRDGKHVGCLEYNKQLDVYLPLADHPVRTIGQGTKVLGFDFGPHADLVATVDSAANVTVLSFPDGKKFEIPTGQRLQASVKFSPDGKTLVTAGYGTKAYLWSTATREPVREFALGTRDGGLTPAFSPDGKILAVGNRNSTTGLFDVATAKLLHTLERAKSHELRFDPSGKTLAVVYVDGQLVLWDVETGKLKESIQAWANELYRVDWTPDGSVLVTGGSNSPLTFWNSTDLSIVGEFECPEWILSARFSPDGTNLIFSGQNRSPENRYVETWAVP